MFSPLFKLQQKVNLKVFSAADGHGDEDGRDGIWLYTPDRTAHVYRPLGPVKVG